jgi:hypothetical protein
VNPHREKPTMPDHVNKLRKGPAEKCPACNAKSTRDSVGVYSSNSSLTKPRACNPGQRVATGLFRKCEVDGEHLHESCKVCGFSWLSEFAEKG